VSRQSESTPTTTATATSPRATCSAAVTTASALDEQAVETVVFGPKMPSTWLTAAPTVASGMPTTRDRRT